MDFCTESAHSLFQIPHYSRLANGNWAYLDISERIWAYLGLVKLGQETLPKSLQFCLELSLNGRSLGTTVSKGLDLRISMDFLGFDLRSMKRCQPEFLDFY